METASKMSVGENGRTARSSMTCVDKTSDRRGNGAGRGPAAGIRSLIAVTVYDVIAAVRWPTTTADVPPWAAETCRTTDTKGCPPPSAGGESTCVTAIVDLLTV